MKLTTRLTTRHVLALSLSVLAAMATHAPAASAGTGAEAVASCERVADLPPYPYNFITVTAPKLDAVYNQIIYPGGWLVSNPLQWVKYRAHLYRYQSGRWTKIVSGPWLATQVSAANLSGSWYDETRRQWVRGSTTFDGFAVGGWAYRVAAEYLWVPFFDSVGSSYAPEHWLPHVDDRKGAYYMSQVAYCVY